MERIAVVIPAFNAASCIRRAVESCLLQEGVEVEIVIVDNNSSDHTREVVTTLINEYPGKIRLIEEHKQGAPAARNTGWKNCAADIIQFLDADDELLPGKLKRQLNLIRKHKADMIIGTPLLVDGNTREVLEVWEDIWKGVAHGSHCGQTSANLYSIHSLREVGGWTNDISHGQDTDLLLKLLCRG
ncbi:MAG: glycosyltransferase family 2 protein [Saprospiraceae bacterium]